MVLFVCQVSGRVDVGVCNHLPMAIRHVMSSTESTRAIIAPLPQRFTGISRGPPPGTSVRFPVTTGSSQ